MRTIRLLGIGALLLGALLLAFAALEGDLRVGLFLIVPFVHGTGLVPFLGMALLVAGVVMLMLAALPPVRFESEATEGDAPVVAKRRSGGVVLLGPIPIVWGDAKTRGWMIAVGAGILLLWIVLILR